MTPFCAADIKHDEGFRALGYQDTLGIWTIGYGHVGPGIDAHTVWSRDEADRVFQADLDSAVRNLDADLPWWRHLSDPRQDVLANMTFNLGIGGVSKFKHALAAMQCGDWSSASAEMLSSVWAGQVGNRATRLAKQMLVGERIDPLAS